METRARAEGRAAEGVGRLARARGLVVRAFDGAGSHARGAAGRRCDRRRPADGLSFDRTSGGYEPPYTDDYTGEPIDWEAAHLTEEGFFKEGYVVDLYVDCTSGMVSFEVYGSRWDWRELSGRALAVHKPAEACEIEGFTPDF